MTQNSEDLAGETGLVTGAAHRIGAAIARHLHAAGMDLALHYRHSREAAEDLKKELESRRPDSVCLIQGDLHETTAFPSLMEQVQAFRGGLDLLVNNASSFYPTPLDRVDETQWNDLLGTNLKAPFFLALAALPMLRRRKGCIVNLVDIHAERPLKNHAIYSMAKAGNAMMVKALARELGPDIRVNGIAPGTILWPEQRPSEKEQAMILERTALKRLGSPEDIARTLLFLVRDATYITGQIIAVDGGRTSQQ